METTTTKKEQRQAAAKAKRAALVARSIRAKAILQGNVTGCPPAMIDRLDECEKVNDVIQLQYVIETGQEDFRTFKGWKEEGLSVRKGEHGFAVWGRPRKFEKHETGPDGAESDKEYKAFPIAYLFHAGQVEKREDGKTPRPEPQPAPPASVAAGFPPNGNTTPKGLNSARRVRNAKRKSSPGSGQKSSKATRRPMWMNRLNPRSFKPLRIT